MKPFPKVVFSDFDGTLTEQGKFSPVFFDVLNLIKKNNSELVVVTGRPLSWAHFLLTHFDLDCVLTEGGGMISLRDGETHFFHDKPLVGQEHIDKLKGVTNALLDEFTQLKLSEDSLCRMTDRAIDLNLLRHLNQDAEIEQFLSQNNINFSRSNVHLNFWSGNISKRKSIEYYLEMKKIDQSECVFIGDSLNDESAFEFMSHSVGVSNISEVIGSLRFPPKIILNGEDRREVHGVKYYLNSLI